MTVGPIIMFCIPTYCHVNVTAWRRQPSRTLQRSILLSRKLPTYRPTYVHCVVRTGMGNCLFKIMTKRRSSVLSGVTQTIYSIKIKEIVLFPTRTM